MKIFERKRVSGHYKIERLDGDKWVTVQEKNNVVVQGFFTGLFTHLQGTDTPMEVTHFALGTGTTKAMKSNTALEAEAFRKARTSISSTPTSLVVKLSLAPSEAVMTIREIGLFMEATDTPGSGNLLSRVNVNVEKNASTQYLITYTLTIQ